MKIVSAMPPAEMDAAVRKGFSYLALKAVAVTFPMHTHTVFYGTVLWTAKYRSTPPALEKDR